MKAWLATAGGGDSAKTRPPAAARDEDVRQKAWIVDRIVWVNVFGKGGGGGGG